MKYIDLTKEDEPTIAQELKLVRKTLEDLTSIATGIAIREGAEV